jgi:hypothetical protein
LQEAKQLADKLDEEGGHGSRSQTLDCAHAQADSL